MFKTPPYLRIRRPSPTAVEFTVSTLPTFTTSLRLSLYAVDLTRSILCSWILLVLYAIYTNFSHTQTPTTTISYPPHHSPSSSSSSSIPYIPTPTQFSATLSYLLTTPPGHLASHLATSALPVQILIPLCLGALYILTLRLYTEESLLVLRGLGIQTKSTKKSILTGKATTRFIPTQKIQDILINEAFWGFGVKYCLIVVVEEEEDVVLVFPKLLPRRKVLERVWRGVRECLFEEGEGKG
ncbi:hypothetical protein F5Y18DRAFT_435108 [Xylariaceae sp. FL1019]|nr:hypothetical protein F5Y18DRAFT_435108 [Xylariaceae sp. FL1019]